MNGTPLTGLEGENPLGFLAALGVQVAFSSESEQPRIWWNDGVTSHAVADIGFTTGRIADRVLDVIAGWRNSPAMNPKRFDGTAMPKGDKLKLIPGDIRSYLEQSRQCSLKSAGALATALVAEGSLDNNGKAKPSDLYFSAGQVKFLNAARQVLAQVSREEVLEALEGPWSYTRKLPSLGWDIVDDRVYALLAYDPSSSGEKKSTNPGAEALALLGLSCHPVFAARGRTLTQGCSGSWKAGSYSWPLWTKPAAPNAVKALLAHAYHHPKDSKAADRQLWLRSWGVFRVLRSPIRRSSQGGYGTFSPPEVAWQAQQQ